MAEEHPQRLYSTESVISLSTGYMAMLPPNELHAKGNMPIELEQVLQLFHIYLIGRRPALAIDPASFSYDDGIARGNLIYRIGGKINASPFECHHPLPDDTAKIMVGPYPHREYVALNASGKVISRWPTMTLGRFAKECDGLDQLDIVYVGQAFGDGTRNAVDRLRNHSTLQKILAETATNRPDEEIVLVLAHYTPYTMLSNIDGRANCAISGDRDTNRWLNMYENPLSEKEQVSLAEAGLIRYFRPIYNQVYKNTFPAEDQKVLDHCYKLDFSGLIVEINTEDLGIRIKSQHMQKGMHHIAKFDLHDVSKRRSFFAITDADDNVIETMNEGGPIY